MPEIEYEVRGFLTVRRSPMRIPLRGSLTLRVDPQTGLFGGDLVLDESHVSRTVLGARLLTGTVRIAAESPVVGQVDRDGRLFGAVTVNAVLGTIRAGGRTVLGGGSCRTSTGAVVPLRSRPGFALERGGRVVGSYYRPPFTGGGWLTPLVNLLASGPGNAVAIDLIPRASRAPGGHPGGG